MRALTIEDLNAAAHVGGAGSLTMRQELEPASGPDGVIAPAKYVDDRGNATYIFAKRYEEDQEKPVKTVMIDSKGSFANRAEETRAFFQKYLALRFSMIPMPERKLSMIISFHIVASMAIFVSEVIRVNLLPRRRNM